MSPQESTTTDLIKAAREQIAAGNIDPTVILELQARYARKNSPDEQKAIRELDRSVLIPYFGATKLPPEVIPIVGTKSSSQSPVPHPKRTSKRRSKIPALLGEVVREALLELLETKHLFQCVHVQVGKLLEPVPKQEKVSKDIPEMLRLMTSTLASIPRNEARLANTVARFRFRQSWQFTCEDKLSAKDNDSGIVSLPPIRIHCAHCDAIKALHRPQTDAQRAVSWSFENGSDEKNLAQIFALCYQCQNCHGEPIIFFIRRDNDKLTLLGRSQFEPISAPSCIPKHVARYYRDAHIALKTGHPLAAIFYLRTAVEQYMRKIVKPTARISGEEMAEQYNKQLPSDFPGRFPSLKKIYQDLSSALHEAREDEELFVNLCRNFEKHLEAIQVFRS